MGHVVNAEREYRLLQQRLDRHITGAPESPVFMQILRLLFTPEDAEFARHLPGGPTSLDLLSSRLGLPRDELGARLTDMAQRGLVVDLEHNGHPYFALAPVAMGFFEFTFMRTRDDLPMAELARLFDAYMREDDRFPRSVFRGQTQVGRSLVREEALPESEHTEILDWERASHILESASTIGVSVCPCRHKASHLGEACNGPEKACFSLNYAAEAIIRAGAAEPISTDEAMRVLETCKEAGLAQTGDNVQRKVTYICNCCGCCCGMIQAIKDFDIRCAIVTSNWIMEVDPDACKGCGRCVEACPVEAIELAPKDRGPKDGKMAVRDDTLCLGCGVCYSACRFGAITMKPRKQRVFTPETVFDRVVSMAIERGKLADLIFDVPERLSHRALGRVLAVLEKSPPFKAAMAIKPLRSAFLSMMVKGITKGSGDLAEVFA